MKKSSPARQTTTISTISLINLVCSEETKEEQDCVSFRLSLKAILIGPRAGQWVLSAS